MKKLILANTLIVILFLGACNFNQYKPIGSGNLLESRFGFKEEKIAHNKWLISYETVGGTKDAEALKLLYRRIDEFGKQQCKKGFKSEKPDILASDVGVTSTAILTCNE
ncbi:MAG: hypothetical protein ACHQJ6_00940 [Candidatus Berkiellales bacterium]